MFPRSADTRPGVRRLPNWLTCAGSPAADSRCFHETIQCIEGRFLEYWRSHGLDLGDPAISERESLALFGYPISPEFTQRLEDGRDHIVPYPKRLPCRYS
jgi:hypothetical protein